MEKGQLMMNIFVITRV